MFNALHLIKKLIPKKSTLIIGLSGGPDSVYLLNLLVEERETLGLTLIAAHLDHQWRINSADDVLFCAELCKMLQVNFISSTINELNLKLKHNGSLEETGRIYRNHFFNNLKEQYNANFIALGHHADDQLETFFIKLIRGATPSGLQCMHFIKNGIFRPLLTTHKKTIIEDLQKKNIRWLTDETNISPIYLRNRIRYGALPALNQCDTRVEKNILRTITSLQESEKFLEKLTQETLSQLLIINKNIHNLDVKKVEQLDLFMQYRVVSLWLFNYGSKFILSRAFLNEILRFLLNKRGGTHQVSPSLKIIKKNNYAIIKPIN